MLRWLFVNRSISAKIVWSTVLISLVPLLVLSYLFYQSSARSLERTMVRSSEQNADYLSSYLDEYFRNISASALQVYRSEILMYLIKDGVDFTAADSVYTKELFQSFYRLVQSKNEDIMKILVFGKDNKLRDSWSRAAYYDEIAFDDRVPYRSELLDLPFQSSLMFAYEDTALKERFFVYSITIYEPFYREKQGTFVFYIQEKALKKVIEKNNRSPNVIVLQNGNGETFYETSDRYDDKIAPFERPAKPSGSGNHHIGFTEGKQLLLSDSSLDNGNIGLTIVYPNTEMDRNRQNILTITIGALVVVMLFIFAFSALAQRYITRPIQMLGKAMKDVRKGNFNVSVKPYRWHDDLTELMRSFSFMTDKIRDLIESEYQTQLRNKEAQILALQMQINPHFLNNTLQTIGGKAVLTGDYEIHEMCRALGDMFRYSFYEGNTESTIGRELAHVNNYIYIQRFRFEEALEAEFDVGADLMDCSVIRFVLQPVFENVIVHALGKQEHALLIRAGAAREGGDVVITVQDNGPGMDEKKLADLRLNLERRSLEVFAGVSIGLKNVHERIRLVYGEPYGIEVDSETGKGTSVRIRIPYGKRGKDDV